MSTDPYTLRATVIADLPGLGETAVRGTLRLDKAALVLERTGGGAPLAIPLRAIERADLETTLGMLPALQVTHRIRGQEARARFTFVPDEDEAPEGEAEGLSERISPGLAREAAERLEGGFRALAGGFRESHRVVRQAVEGVARQEEYRAWPAAIARAREEAPRRDTPGESRPETSESRATEPLPAIVPHSVTAPVGDEAAFAWLRAEVAAWLAALGARARELGVRDVPVIQPQYPLDSPVCRIVVVGEFSRGKSTLINALFGIHGEIALPTGMTPTTPLACAIRVPRVGESDGATISYRTARPARQLSLDQFRAEVRLNEEGAGNGASAMHLEEARRLEVRITGAYLPAGVEIEDTPGLNEQAGRSAGALAALGRADLVLFVLAADQLLGDLERALIEQTLVAGRHRNVLFLVNFWDSIDDEGQRATLRERATALLRAVPSPFTADGPPLFYISALQAARAQRQRQPAPEESGIPALRATLRHLLGPGSNALLRRARAGRALRYLALLHRAVSDASADAALGAAGETRATPKEHQQQAAVVAAQRLLDALPGAVEGSIAPLLRTIRAGEHGGLPRLAAQPPADPAAFARALALELRAAAAACAQAAQQALDLITAQVRAAYLTRGLPAPTLEPRIAPPEPLSQTADGPASLASTLEDAAEALRQRLVARAERLRAALGEELRPSMHPTSAPTATVDREQARARLGGLRALEDDIARLEELLAPLMS